MEVTINGQKFEAEKGKTIIEIADANKIPIPRFCYHKNLEVVAQCRMCLVEVEGVPKPLAACSTPCTDGMKVQTASPTATSAQESVLEFLLLNHPLDCPICDKGGECPLQNNAFQYGSVVSSMQDIKRRLDKNRDFGEHIVLDQERCILCTRCVRFCADVAGTAEIGVDERGAHSELQVFDEKGVYNEWGLNIVDLCPVGALTNKDFRFSARPWEMKKTESFCPHCPEGCSSTFWVKTGFREQKMLRMTSPGDAENWLCDYGRLNYKVFNNQENHLKEPHIKINGTLQKVTWGIALEKTKELLKEGAQFEVSGNLTCEALSAIAVNSSVIPRLDQGIQPILKAWHILKEKDLLSKKPFKKLVQLGGTVRETYPVFYLDINESVELSSSHDFKELPVEEDTALAISETHMNTEGFLKFIENINKKILIIPLFKASNTVAALENGIAPWQLTGIHNSQKKVVFFMGRTLKQNFDYHSLKNKYKNSKLILMHTIESPLTELAEVILPMQDLAESGGHFYTYSDLFNQRQPSYFKPCMNVQGKALPDWEIIKSLS